MSDLILASQSPRRQELLSMFGIPFTVIPSEAEENCALQSCALRVAELARMKCLDVAARYPDAMVLGADTLVCVGDRILGKPKNAEDAAEMLRMLSGREHSVFTGVCLYLPNGEIRSASDETRVEMLPMSEEQIERYIATGEPMDKAGAYAIQGFAGIFVRSLEGSYSNVIGLPLHILTGWFNEIGLPLFSAVR